MGEYLLVASVPHEIVGEVGDTREWGPHAAGPAMIYATVQQHSPSGLAFVLETEHAPADLHGAVVAAVAAASPDVAVHQLRSMEAALAENTARSAFMARVMTLFAAVALILALVGVYGTAATAVARRLPELGVRRALGAGDGAVARLVLMRMLGTVSAGVGVGLALAALSTRGLAAFLAELPATDPASFAASTLGLVLATLLACLAPVWRALRVEPVEVLRRE